MEVTHPALDHPILIHFSRREVLTAEKILTRMEKVMQSRTTLSFDDNLCIKVTRVKEPGGEGWRRENQGQFNVWFPTKKSIIRIQNEDNLCCARALVVAKAKVDKDGRWETIRKGDKQRHTLQKRLALQLMEMAGLTGHTGPCRIEELQKLQGALPGYQIKVYDRDLINGLAFKGPVEEKVLHLYLHDNHYDAIMSMPGFVNNSYYCDLCEKGYKQKEEHRCETRCVACKGDGQCKKETWVHCPDCLRWFFSQK